MDRRSSLVTRFWSPPYLRRLLSLALPLTLLAGCAAADEAESPEAA
jgi:hypothetical protein